MGGLLKGGNESASSLKANLLVKRDGITGEWRKLHNAQLNALYCPPKIIGNFISARLRRAGHVAGMEQFRNVFRGKESFREAAT